MVHPPAARGFYVIVCTPAPLGDARDGVLDALRPVVSRSRGAVLVSSGDLGPPGTVLVTGRTPDGQAVGPIRWFGLLSSGAQVGALADWLDIGGPLAPLPAEVVALLALPSRAVA